MVIQFSYEELKHIMILTFQRQYIENYRYKKHRFYFMPKFNLEPISNKITFQVGYWRCSDDYEYKDIYYLLINDNYDVLVYDHNLQPVHIDNQAKIRKYINFIVNKKEREINRIMAL